MNNVAIIMKCALLALMLLSESARATVVKLDQLESNIKLEPHLEYNIGNEDLFDPPPIEGWSSFTLPQVKLGFDPRVHWFRFQLQNNTQFTQDPYLEFDSPLLDNLIVYSLTAGQVTSVQHLGDNQNFNQRPVKTESYVIPLLINPNEQIEVYISVQSEGLLHVPMLLWQKEYFQQVKSFQKLKSGILYGLYLAVIVALLVVYTRNKDKILLTHAAFMFSLFAITLTLSGQAFQYLWPTTPELQQHSFFIFTCLAIFFSCVSEKQTLVNYYQTHLIAEGKTIWLLNVLAVSSLIIIPVSLVLPYEFAIYFIFSVAIAICFTHLYLAWSSWQQGLHEHQELNVSLIILLLTIMYIAINSLSNIKLPFENSDIFAFSLAIQALVIMSGLLHQFQSQPIVQELEIAEEASDRMLELQFALRELEDKNKQLEKLNTLDTLSGINNRAHFDKRLLAEVRRARREIYPLSLIMFDIDHFKAFNDNYGHLLGDEVIRTVALTASEQLSRPSDEIFRYGGEEYAVILPNTTADGAYKVAEKIRLAIANAVISHKDQQLSCFVSLGLTCHLFEEPITPEQLIEQADSALYKAKQSGRNQVQIYNKEET